MAKYSIAWMPGDGIGNEVMDATKIVLDAVGFDAEYHHADIGWEFWKTEGDAFPERTKEFLKSGKTQAALFGAITSKPKEEAEKELIPELQGKGLVYSSPIVRLRQEFNLHTNLRPCKSFPQNPLNYRDDIDWAIFRENTEGMYGGVEFHPVPQEVYDVLDKNHPKMKKFKDAGLDNLAISTRIMTRQACRNIVTQAFEYAKKFGRESVTVVDKPNVIRETGGLMVRTAREVAKNYPEIKLWEANIDAMTMFMLKNPMDYDVIVAENMFGDILSDLAAQMVGGLGFAPSGNIGDNYAVFEPCHGSAPKHYGKNKTNPIAMIMTAKMMLEWLGEAEKAGKIEKAIAKVIAEGKVKTYDLGGTHNTTEMAEEIARNL